MESATQTSGSLERAPRFRARACALLLAAGFFSYFVFGFAWISLPGPYYDEMLFLNGSLTGNSLISYYHAVRIFHYNVPTMLMPYIGSTKGLLWRAVFLVWPPSVYSARVPVVLLGALTLLLFYLWAKRFYSPRVAALGVLFVGVDPAYIFTSRLDWGPVVLQRLLAVAGLLLSARWLETSRNDPRSPENRRPCETGAAALEAFQERPAKRSRGLGWLAGAGFCFGLGLWDKSSFAWFLIALAVTLPVLFPRDVMRRLRPALLIFVLALLAGASPLIRYNLSKSKWRPKTFHSVHWAVEPGAIGQKLGNLRLSLDGRFVYSWVAGYVFDPAKAEAEARGIGKLLARTSLVAPPSGTFLPWILGLTPLAALFAGNKRRAILFPLLMTALMWMQILPLKEGGGPHHFVLAFPFPHLAIAAAVGFIWNRLRGALRLVPAVLVACVLATAIGWDARTVWEFRETGGAWNWSDGSYQIAAYLDKHPPKKLMCMDWGFSYPLLLLTQGRVNMQDAFTDAALAMQQELANHPHVTTPPLAQPGTLYLFHAGGYQSFPAARQVFDAAVRNAGLQEKVVATFTQRNGQNLAIVSEVVPGCYPQAQ